MLRGFNRFLDRMAEFLAARKGLLPLLGLLLVVLNLVVQFVPALAALARHDWLLHLGVVVAILGFLLGWAL